MTNTASALSGASRTVRVFGSPVSTKAFEIRDFLNRSVVQYEWIELSEGDAKTMFGVSSLDDPKLPVCVFPDGSRLYGPTIRDVAERLGWVTTPKLKEYDLSIYGAGPAGLSAAVYAASEGLKTVVIERNAVGGQAGSSSMIENYMGFPDGISGAHLAERARQQAVKFGAEILHLQEGVKAAFKEGKIHVDMADGAQLVAKTNICATGIGYRRLDLINEDDFLGAGLYYGASASEGPMCVNTVVYVIGGGNSAGQAAMHFSQYARKVVMLIRGAALADTLSHYLIEKIKHTANIEVKTRTSVERLYGDKHLAEIDLLDRGSGAISRVPATRLFVCIGGAPNTEWAKDTPIVRDQGGYLVTGADLLVDGALPAVWPLARVPYFLETSVPGSFAAGDVRHDSIKRVASGVGEGAMAVTFVHRYLAGL